MNALQIKSIQMQFVGHFKGDLPGLDEDQSEDEELDEEEDEKRFVTL